MSVVLVVDDELKVREYLTNLLQFQGHDVLAVADGRAALQCMAKQRPDLVLLDLMMPGMSGQDVMTEIRRIDGGPRLPVVMLTAAASDDQAWQAWSAGADYILVKPLDADKLTGVLHCLASSGEHVDEATRAGQRSTLAVVEQPSRPTSVLDEEARLRALARYAILDSQPDSAFDDLRSLAQAVTSSAVAAIGFFDRDRVWFKSQVGIDVAECPREVLLEPGSTTVKLRPAGPGELAASGRVASTPCVTSDGYTLGCLIVADQAARVLRPDESAQLEALARQIVRLLELRRTLLSYHTVVDGAENVVFHLDEQGRFVSLTPTWSHLTGFGAVRSVGQKLSDFVHEDDRERLTAQLADVRSVRTAPVECRLYRLSGDDVPVEVASRPLVDEAGRALGLMGVIVDISERQAREVEAQHLQKLEALGRLSAGLAHEINTPIQFVGDNARFLAESYEAMLKLVLTYRRVLDVSSGAISWWERQEVIQQAELEADVNYLAEEVPAAVKQSLEGVERVASLVRAMKTFSHPGGGGQVAADLNEALQATLTVARNQIRDVADPVLDLGELPPVICNVADMNQVFLNMVINAADAIEETGEHGTITVTSRHGGGDVVITVSDTGTGIPQALQRRMFEPFFTTKEVGRGTGQGLTLARAVICDQHHGSLTLTSELGVGTTFVIRLPVDGRPVEAGASA